MIYVSSSMMTCICVTLKQMLVLIQYVFDLLVITSNGSRLIWKVAFRLNLEKNCMNNGMYSLTMLVLAKRKVTGNQLKHGRKHIGHYYGIIIFGVQMVYFLTVWRIFMLFQIYSFSRNIQLKWIRMLLVDYNLSSKTIPLISLHAQQPWRWVLTLVTWKS